MLMYLFSVRWERSVEGCESRVANVPLSTQSYVVRLSKFAKNKQTRQIEPVIFLLLINNYFLSYWTLFFFSKISGTWNVIHNKMYTGVFFIESLRSVFVFCISYFFPFMSTCRFDRVHTKITKLLFLSRASCVCPWYGRVTNSLYSTNFK